MKNTKPVNIDYAEIEKFKKILQDKHIRYEQIKFYDEYEGLQVKIPSIDAWIKKRGVSVIINIGSIGYKRGLLEFYSGLQYDDAHGNLTAEKAAEMVERFFEKHRVEGGIYDEKIR